MVCNSQWLLETHTGAHVVALREEELEWEADLAVVLERLGLRW